MLDSCISRSQFVYVKYRKSFFKGYGYTCKATMSKNVLPPVSVGVYSQSNISAQNCPYSFTVKLKNFKTVK